MKHAIAQELRLLSDDEILAVSGGKGKDPGSPNDPTLPKPPPPGGIYLFPLIYKMN